MKNEKLSFTNSLLSQKVKEILVEVDDFGISSEKYEMKSKDFYLQNSEYLRLVERSKLENEENSILALELNGKEVFIMNFENSEIIQNLSKLHSSISPDVCLIQDYPRNYLIDTNVRNPKTNLFSNRNYISQLSHSAYSIYMSNKSPDFIIPPKQPEEGEEVEETLFSPFEMKTISNELLETLNPIYSSIPQQVFKHNLINNYTLPQIFNIFLSANRELQFEKDIYNSQMMRKIISGLIPDVAMRWEDQYLSTLVEYFIADKKSQKIIVFTKSIHFESLLFYLQHRSPSNLEKEMQLSELRINEFRDTAVEEYAEKLAILDSFTSYSESQLHPIDKELSISLMKMFIPESKFELCCRIYASKCEDYLIKKYLLKDEFKEELTSHYLEKILIL